MKEGECAIRQDKVESANSFLQSQPVYTSIRLVTTSSYFAQHYRTTEAAMSCKHQPDPLSWVVLLDAFILLAHRRIIPALQPCPNATRILRLIEMVVEGQTEHYSRGIDSFCNDTPVPAKRMISTTTDVP